MLDVRRYVRSPLTITTLLKSVNSRDHLYPKDVKIGLETLRGRYFALIRLDKKHERVDQSILCDRVWLTSISLDQPAWFAKSGLHRENAENQHRLDFSHLFSWVTNNKHQFWDVSCNRPKIKQLKARHSGFVD